MLAFSLFSGPFSALARRRGLTYNIHLHGAVVHSGERCVRIAKVGGSNPPGSTTKPLTSTTAQVLRFHRLRPGDADIQLAHRRRAFWQSAEATIMIGGPSAKSCGFFLRRALLHP